VRLGDGYSLALSPDKKWVISVPLGTQTALTILPTGAGEQKTLPADGMTHEAAVWLPDGKRFVFSAFEPKHGVRLYVQDLSGGKPRAISPEGVLESDFAISPDLKSVAGVGPDRLGYVYPVDGGDPRLIPGFEKGDRPIAWDSDNRSQFIYDYRQIPAQVFRLDTASGKKTAWKQLVPSDSAGIDHIAPIFMSGDKKSYVYGYSRILSDLYLVTGLK
jgi:hypothetical protein